MSNRNIGAFNVVVLLLFVVAVILNFQAILVAYTGDSYILRAWIILPIFLLIFYVPKFAVNFSLSLIAFLVTVFLLILCIHTIVQSAFYGMVGGIWAFISYGLWIGLFVWMQYAEYEKVRRLVINIFLMSALLQMCGVFADFFISGGFFKMVTIGDNIVRYYGISTSVSVMSLQLAIGVLVAIKFSLDAKTTIKSISALFVSFLLVVALFIVSVRAPAFYLILALTFVALSRLNYGVREFRRILIVISAGFAVGGFMIITKDAYLTFLLEAFSFADEGNQGRLAMYSLAIQMFLQDWWVPWFGFGSAELTQIPTAFGTTELTVESSLIKGLLELGIIGMLPVIFLIIAVFSGMMIKWRHPVIRKNIEFFAILTVVLLQCMTHETFKTWIGSFYFSLSIGICVRILMEAKYFKRPARIKLGLKKLK